MESFKIGQRVKIKLTGREGEVDSISEGRQGTLYLVEYADGQGRVCSLWFEPEKLAAVESV